MTEVIIAEVRRKGSTRETIADRYRVGIIACQHDPTQQPIDWGAVNAAILERYTPAGLNRIKSLAWGLK